MKKILLAFVCILNTCLCAFAQQGVLLQNGTSNTEKTNFATEHKTVHERQHEFYKSFNLQHEYQYDSLYAVSQGKKYAPVPRKNAEQMANFYRENPPCNLTRQVYGWNPYWISSSAFNNYDYSLISTFCYFNYDLNINTGGYSSIHAWKTTNSINLAKAAGCKVDLCVTNFGSTNNTTFLNNTAAWDVFVDSIKVLLDYRNADGINIDFEGMGSSHKTKFTQFMTHICDRLHTERPGTQVSMALYSVDWSATFDLPALNLVVDAFIIMGYDYYYSGSSTAGPSGPLYHFTNGYAYSQAKSVGYYSKGGVSLNKLLLGVPYYGEEWPISSTTLPSPTTGTGTSRIYNYAKNNYWGTYTRNFNTRSATPYYNVSGNTRQCWVDDEFSYDDRYDFVRDRNIAGIGIWALGYDDGYTQLWDLLKDKFTDCAAVVCADTAYDSGGPEATYHANERYTMTLGSATATSIELNFLEFDLENGFDSLYVYNGVGTTGTLLGGYTGTTLPPTLTTTSSGYATILFKSDGATQKNGFKIAWACAATCQPTTTINTLNNWYNNNFTANFTDNTCSPATIQNRYYQALEYTGSEWRGNTANGFFNDAYDLGTLHSSYTTPASSGAWSVTAGSIQQTDETVNNTNIYTPLTQTAGNYLYHFRGKMDGTGTNRRMGMHFFCSDGSLDQRGDSYMVYFRADNDKVQIYKAVANVIGSPLTDSPFALDPNVSYDFKITFNSLTGDIKVYVNDVLASQWTDTAPLTTGNAISLRNGNCKAWYDYVKVYKSRSSTTANISVGNAATNDIRTESTNPSTNACRIETIIQLNNLVWSNSDTAYTHIDFTAPAAVAIYDGTTTTDIDTTTNANQLQANWATATDANSGISLYEYAIGTTMGGTEIVNWTSNGTSTNVTKTGLNLTNGTLYFISVRITNAAGLFTTVISDGQRYVAPCNTPSAPTYSNISTTTATANWTAVAGATNYSLEYRAQGAPAFTSVTATTNSYNFTNLSPCTTYEVRVKTNCTGGSSSAFNALTTFTTQTVPAPATPTYSNITTVSATATWTAVSGATNYTLEYRAQGATAFTSVTATTNNYNFTNLSPCTTYEVQIKTNCAGGSSSAFNTLTTFTTQTVPAPSAPTYSNITTTTATANWTAVAGATNYTLEYRAQGASNFISATATSNSYNFTNLNPCTTYEVRIKTNCTGGNSSAFNAINTFSTNSLSATWNAPSGNILNCADALDLTTTITGNTGGTWSGGAYISTAGIFNPAGLNAGGYTVSYTVGTGTNCPTTQTRTLNVVACTQTTNIKVKIMLEGAFNSVTNEMNNTLYSNNWLPLTQPYNIAPFNYLGTEQITSLAAISNNTVDWILIELRDPNNANTLIARRAALLQKDGTIIDTDGTQGVNFVGVNAGNYYVVVRHRNHVPIISNTAPNFPNITLLDLTQTANVKQGSTQLKNVATNIHALKAGDADANGIINFKDFNKYFAGQGLTNGYYLSDYNLDDSITNTDYNLYLPNASAIAVPEVRY